MLPAKALDIALFAVVVLAAAVAGCMVASAASGMIPAQNALFGADTGRVLGDLTGQADNYYRFKVHPWHGWICVFYQLGFARLFGLPAETGVPALCVLIASTCAGLLYVVMRRLEVGSWASASFALLFSATAGFVFWSTLPETHMAGGLSTLVAVLLLTAKPRTARGRFWQSALALAAGFSMVVTNAMVWALRQVEFDVPGLRAFFGANVAKFSGLWRQGFAGIALVFLVWAPQWLFLQKRLGIPFNFLEERHYVEVGSGSFGWSLHVLGILPPGSTVGLILSFAGVGVLIAALRVLKPRLWFIPLFALFGVAFHMIYASDSAFLFAPNYLPLFIVSCALVAKEALPRWFPAAVLPVAALLFVFNLQQWYSQLNTLEAAGQLKSYAAAVHY